MENFPRPHELAINCVASCSPGVSLCCSVVWTDDRIYYNLVTFVYWNVVDNFNVHSSFWFVVFVGTIFLFIPIGCMNQRWCCIGDTDLIFIIPIWLVSFGTTSPNRRFRTKKIKEYVFDHFLWSMMMFYDLLIILIQFNSIWIIDLLISKFKFDRFCFFDR